MSQSDWKDELRKYFESVKIIQKSKAETQESFAQFCEFIVEPAFEILEDEMKAYGIKVRLSQEKSRFVHFEFFFPGSKIDNYHYKLILPRNSYELRLSLVLKGRKLPQSALEEIKEDFMKDVFPSEVMKISKDDLIRDIIAHYRDFNLAALTSRD
jgi:hypothetical protein